jgi:hypothetical protein
LFYAFTKKKVPGTAIRQFFTGSPGGVVPISGSIRTKAEFWAKLFHDLFSSEWTFEAQLEFGDKYFEDGSEKRLRFCKDRALQDKTIRSFIYEDKPILKVSSEDLGEQLDLAMAMYWSNSVNAPGYALKLLCKVVDNHLVAKDDFPKTLISVLGNTSFGRWDDEIPNGRYQRTRSVAMKMWPEKLFVGPQAIMPKILTGGKHLS